MSILIAVLLACGQEKADPLAGGLSKIDEEILRKHATYLAGDALEGRAAGFPGNEKAVEYLVAQVTEYGLKPAGEGEGFTQEFEFAPGKKARNVIALLEGSDPKLKGEFVTVGAHLDHVGRESQKVRGQAGGARPGDDIWNGADDNGSGTSSVLALARAFATAPSKPRRSILFCWWNAEEAGLLGSRHWTENPTRPLENVIYNLNLDMVGRNPDRPVDFEGVKNAEGPALEAIITAACEAEKLKITKYDHHNEAMFRSDGVSFIRKGIAATMIFTYWHDDYHRVGDHADRLAYPNLAKIGRASLRILHEIANRDESLKFNPATPLEGRPVRALGVQGDDLSGESLAALKLGPGNGGYRLAAVSAGGVGEKAGLVAGDVIVFFAGEPLPAEGTLAALRKRIQAVKAKEDVILEILRDDQRKTLKAVWPR